MLVHFERYFQVKINIYGDIAKIVFQYGWGVGGFSMFIREKSSTIELNFNYVAIFSLLLSNFPGLEVKNSGFDSRPLAYEVTSYYGCMVIILQEF